MTEPRPESAIALATAEQTKSASTTEKARAALLAAIEADERSGRAIERAAGVGTGTIPHLRKGGGGLQLDTVEKLAATLNTSVAALIGDPAQANDSDGSGGLPWSALERSSLNPRKTFDEDELTKLADSIAANGLLQPLMVRPHPSKPGRYEIVAGERRWRAFGLLVESGKAEKDALLPATVRTLTDREVALLAMIENLQRADVPPLEEAEGFQTFLAAWPEAGTDGLAEAVGKSRRFVQQRLKLVTGTTAAVQAALAAGRISVTIARTFAQGPLERQDQVLEKYLLQDDWHVADEDDIRRELQRGLFAAERASFDDADYRGDRFTDGEGKVWYTDLAAVRRLQLRAAKAQAASKEPHRAWVKVVDELKDTFYPYQYERQEKPDGGCGYVVEVERDGTIKEHDGLITAQQAAAARAAQARKAKGESAGDSAPKPLSEGITQGLRHAAAQQRSLALRAAVAAAPAQVAQACVVLALLPGYCPTIDMRREAGLQGIDDAHLAAHEAELAGLEDDDACRGPDRVTLLGRLLEDPKLCDLLFRTCVARSLSTGDPFRFGDDALAIALARETAASVADHWTPDEAWLKQCRLPRLQAIARDLGFSTHHSNDIGDDTRPKTKAELIDCLLSQIPRGWIPSEMAFASADDIVAAIDAEGSGS